MKKNLYIFINILLIFMIISLVVISIVWIPAVYYYLNQTFNMFKNNLFLEILYYGISYLISLIGITVFMLSFKFSDAIKNNIIFSDGIANRLKLIAYLILSDCILFSTCIVLLYCYNEFILSPALTFFCIIGYAISFMLFILSNYVKEASIYKEEVEYTL